MTKTKIEKLIAEFKKAFSNTNEKKGEIITISESTDQSFIEMVKSYPDSGISIYAYIDSISYNEGELEYNLTVKGNYLSGKQNAEMQMRFKNIDPLDIATIIDEFTDEFFGIVIRIDLRL